MKARRESYQQGSILRVPRSKGPDIWVFRYYRYHTDGKRERVAEQFSDLQECPNKAAAEKKAEPIRRRINEERTCATFANLCDSYEKDDLPQRPQTAASYRSNLKYLRARWGTYRLDAMISNLMEIQLWLNQLKSQSGESLSKKTRQHIRNLLHRLFEDAMRWGYLNVQRNPMNLIEIRSGARPKPRKLILTPEHFDCLVHDEGLASHVRVMIHVVWCLGVRASELLGLRWTDVHFDRNEISIRRSFVGKHEDETKTEDSEIEDYPMHPLLSAVLSLWKQEQRSAVEKIGGKKREVEAMRGDWVFESAITKRPFHATSLRKDHLQPTGVRLVSCPKCEAMPGKLCRAAGQPVPNHPERVKSAGPLALIGWHTFRHTYRAMLRDLEEPLEVQQVLMRHSNIAMTVEYGKYSKQRKEQMRRANARVVEMVHGLKTDSRRVEN